MCLWTVFIHKYCSLFANRLLKLIFASHMFAWYLNHEWNHMHQVKRIHSRCVLSLFGKVVESQICMYYMLHVVCDEWLFLRGVPIYLCLPWNLQSKVFGAWKKKLKNELRGFLILIDMGFDVGKCPTKKACQIFCDTISIFIALYFFFSCRLAYTPTASIGIIKSLRPTHKAQAIWTNSVGKSIKIDQKPTYKNISVICGEGKWEIKTVFVMGDRDLCTNLW